MSDTDPEIEILETDAPPRPRGTPPEFRELVALTLKTTAADVLDAARQDYRGTYPSAEHYVRDQLAEHLPPYIPNRQKTRDGIYSSATRTGAPGSCGCSTPRLRSNGATTWTLRPGGENSVLRTTPAMHAATSPRPGADAWTVTWSTLPLPRTVNAIFTRPAAAGSSAWS